MKEEYLPEIFEVKYINSSTGAKSIKLINTELMINDPNPELISIKDIDSEKWIEFWDSLERIGIWDLEEEYQGCTLEGGFTWKIHIQYKSRELNSYGANIEPKIVIGNRVYSIIEELWKSIEELII